MELGKQIKKYRGELGFSQDALAERLYVSRQTVSNWENDKTYPDINSLLRLSEAFQVSIDILIKGDVEKMKTEIRQEDKRRFGKESSIFSVLFFATVLTPVPLLHYLDNAGIAIWAVIVAAAFWSGIRVEKMKKTFDIQSYKEIVAFMEGKGLDEIEKAREEGKRIYQKILLTGASALTALLVCAFMMWVLK